METNDHNSQNIWTLRAGSYLFIQWGQVADGLIMYFFYSCIKKKVKKKKFVMLLFNKYDK
jgi:hypothetical protein